MKSDISTDSRTVAMYLMILARSYVYDTNPIGGFDKENIIKKLDIDL